MSWQATELVNFSPATDAPRAVHSLIATLVVGNQGVVTSRILHMAPAVIALCRGYSRARWLDCEVVVVSNVTLVGQSVLVAAAFVADNDIPANPAALNECPTCAFRTGGSSDSLPPVFRFPLSFADSGTSPLIKPAPVEQQRTAISLTFDVIAAGETDTPAAPTAIFSVFLTGHVSLGGAN
jgi:hypothetical protein